MKAGKISGRILNVLFILFLLLTLVGCAKKAETSAVSSDANYEVEVMSSEAPMADKSKVSDAKGVQNGSQASRKVIENKYISMETLEFDTVTTKTDLLIEQYSGYVENADISGNSLSNPSDYSSRYATYTIRIPSEYFVEFIRNLKALGNVTNERVVKEDVTLQYFDLQARINTLKVQETRLLEIVAEGAELTQILEVENKLSDVRYQIESHSATLSNLDNQVSYGTVRFDLREVLKETVLEEPAVTVGEKISKGFSHSIVNVKNFFVGLFVFLVTASPYLVIYGLLIFGVVVLIKKYDKKAKKKAALLASQNQDKIK